MVCFFVTVLKIEFGYTMAFGTEFLVNVLHAPIKTTNFAIENLTEHMLSVLTFLLQLS
jgi:hypothetical protein